MSKKDGERTNKEAIREGRGQKWHAKKLRTELMESTEGREMWISMTANASRRGT